MKAKFSRFVFAAAIAALVILAGAPAVLAQVPNFPSGFSQSQLCPGANPPTAGCAISVNGGTLDNPESGQINTALWIPRIDGGALQLTQNAPNQRGSAWFTTPQPLGNSWTTTFSFKLSPSTSRGDGFAFVIQNSAPSAIGGFGGGLGYGTRCSTVSEGEDHTCVPDDVDPAGDTGIPNSVAIEFDTVKNGYDVDDQHIAVQSCGASVNLPDHRVCNFGEESVSTNFANGESHTARIVYQPFSCELECAPNLFVYLDTGTDPVFSTYINIAGQINGSTAYVGFTAATRGANQSHELVNWTFSPSQTQTIEGGQETTFNFGNFTFTAQLTSGSRQVSVTPILKTQGDCNFLVQQSFSQAQCFVYDDAGGPGNPAAVMFAVTCPDTAGNECSNFMADLGTFYHFTKLNNPGYRGGPPNTGNPLPGWLKGQPSDTNNPCNADTGVPLFQSNQIESFSVQGDPTATTKGKSGGTGSCWVATYNTPNELPFVTGTIPANGANYPQGSSLTSNLSCNAVNMPTHDTKVGPYLTVPATVQVQDPPIPPVLGCSLQVDGGALIDLTATPHPQLPTTGTSHTVIVTVTDSATDTTTSTPITYNVVGPADVALVKLAPFSAATGSKITYAIGVGNLGPNNASNVTVKDVLPAGLSTTGVTASATNVSCSLVNRKIVCTTASKPCTISTVSGVATVTCNVGTIVPLSLSPLNGAAVQISTKVTAAAGTSRNPVVIKNTATVSADNTDPKTSNNSSSASTTVTAH